MAFQLSQQQRNFFDVFGYLKLPALFADQAQDLQQAFDELYQQEQAVDWVHEAHYNKSRHIVFNAAEKHPLLRQLITEPNLDSVFSDLLGNDYNYNASEANIFTGDTYWHSDIYGCHFKYRYVKALMYLDPLTAKTGALCVIPGSHLFGDQYANKLQARVWEHDKHLGIDKEAVPHVAIETQPGDVILFDFRIKHATINHSENRRRLLTISATQRFAQEDEPKLLENLIAGKKLGAVIHSKAFVESLTEQEQLHLEQTLRVLQEAQLTPY